MQEYIIAYSDQGLLARTLGGSIALLLAIQALALQLAADEARLGLGVAGLALPLTYFFIRKRKIRRTGIVLIGYDRIAFSVLNTITIISVHEVAYYRISHDHGTALTLALKNGNKFRVKANHIFCDPSKLEVACNGIEKILQEFRVRKASNTLKTS